MSQQINLFTPVFLKQPKYFSAVTMVQALAAVFVGALAIYAYTVYQNSTLERVAKSSELELKQRREQLVKFGAEFSAKGASKLMGGEDSLSEGFSRYLSALSRRNLPGVWLTGFRLGGKGSPVVLKGRALRADLVPPYLQSIGSDETMRGRSVSELKLEVKEEAAPAPAPATPAAPAPAKPPAPAAVARYVEFGVTLSANAPDGPALKPRPAGKGAS
jgi:hypothetical protein